jgi:Xaa-Pro aminopeptidase
VTEVLPLVDLPPPPDHNAIVDARRARLGRFRDLLRDQAIATGIVARLPLIRHLTGVRADAGVLVVSPDDAWLTTAEGSSGLEAVEDLAIRVVTAQGYDRDAFVDPAASVASAAADEMARRRLPGPVGAESAYLPAAIVLSQTERPADIGPLLDGDRWHKDEMEVVSLRRAVAVVERALSAVASMARPGATERDLLRAVAESIYRDVGDDFELAANIATGERTALEDPHASDRVMQPGDAVLLDLYPVVEGHVADLTRTWVVGEASSATRQRHATLAAALAAGASALEGAETAGDIDRVVRHALADRLGALARSMQHHTGHGIGIFGWERPWLGTASADPIGPGCVVCIEPGVYESGVGGLRLEGEYLLADAGVERLDTLPDELLELPA